MLTIVLFINPNYILMATVKYLIQTKNNPAQIYLRFSIGRNNVLKRKTGFVTNPKEWSSLKGLPKPNSSHNKQLISRLKKLESNVIQNYNRDFGIGTNIDGNWLSRQILTQNDQNPEDDHNWLVIYTQEFINKLGNRIDSRGRKGVSKASVTKYNTILKKFIEYEKYYGTKLKLTDVNLKFREAFLTYLTEVDVINDNTAGRYISLVKTIIYDARKNGFDVSHQIQDFKGFKVKPPIVTLNVEEIEQIRKTSLEDPTLASARDWMVIGCYTGQRVSDLLRMNTTMIEDIKGYNFIVLDQVKTGKQIHIPIHPIVQSILDKRNGIFPDTFGATPDSNSAYFNRYLKEVCRLANLDEIVKGNLLNPSTRRKELGVYPKWKLVSSHICRRSFATNFYAQRKYPTPVLMNITGHSTEAMFLDYIGKKPIDYSLQLAQTWSEEL
jgi:integrase